MYETYPAKKQETLPQNPDVLPEGLAINISFKAPESNQITELTIPFDEWQSMPLRNCMVLTFARRGEDGFPPHEIHNTLKEEMVRDASSEDMRKALLSLVNDEMLERVYDDKKNMVAVKPNGKGYEFAAGLASELRPSAPQ